MTLESAAEFLSWQAPPIVPIIKERLLPEASTMMLWGKQETFKSWMAMELGFTVAEGKEWLVFETNPHNVILINAELPKIMYHERWKQFARTRGYCPRNLHVVNGGIKLDAEDGLYKLETWVAQTKAKLVIIDNLYRMLSSDLNNGQAFNKLIDTLDRMKQTYGCSFCFVHHSRKTQYDIYHQEEVDRGVEDMTGSKLVANNAALIMHVKETKFEGVNHAITLYTEKAWFEKNPPPSLTFAVDDDARFHII